jgi:phosphoserine phosphatase
MNLSNVSPVLSARESTFINSVLQLQPRLAIFDCDGTLWAGDAGEGFFKWELERGLVSEETVSWARVRHAAYLAGKVSEDDMCGEMATMHHGLHEAVMQSAADEYFDAQMAAQIFPEMRVLVRRLQESRCDVWAVSSTNEWVIRAGMKQFGIPAKNILAAAARVVGGVITDELIRVPSGEGKPRAIRDVIGTPPDAIFGNSIWDAAMLGIARHPFVVNPTPELETIAAQKHWPVYRPDPLRPPENQNPH